MLASDVLTSPGRPKAFKGHGLFDAPRGRLHGQLPTTAVARSAEAFKRGFVAVLASYLAVVELLGELVLNWNFPAATMVFITTFVGGPVCFGLSVCLGRKARRYAQRVDEYSKEEETMDPETRLSTLKVALIVCIISVCLMGVALEEVALQDLEFSRFVADDAMPELQAWPTPPPSTTPPLGQGEGEAEGALFWQLPWGLASVAAACVLADYVAMHTEDGDFPLMRYAPGVDWPTAMANMLTLCFGHMMVMAKRRVLSRTTLQRLEKVHYSACGTLSAYGGFTEAVALPALSGQWRQAFANWAVNACFALMGVGLVLLR